MDEHSASGADRATTRSSTARGAEPAQSAPVFSDPSGRRWRILRGSALAVSVCSTLLAVVLIAAVLIPPLLPATWRPVHTSVVHSPRAALTKRDRSALATRRQLLREIARSGAQPVMRGPTRGVAAPTSTRAMPAAADPLVVGFYVNWDDNSWDALQAHVREMDWLIGEWSFLDETGSAVRWADADTTREPRRDVFGFLATMPESERPRVFTMLTNVDSRTQQFDSARVAALVATPTSRARVIEALRQTVVRRRLAGICVDLENVAPSSQQGVTTFVAELRAALAPLRARVLQTLSADASETTIRDAARNADMVIAMLYDEHDDQNEPGPVASQAWYERSAERFARLVPRTQLLLAIGTYGYDWNDADSRGRADVLTFGEVMQAAREHPSGLRFDSLARNPLLTWTDPDSTDHVVWFLDGTTAWNSLATTVRLGAAGVAIWRLGAEDPSLWRALGKSATRTAATALDSVAPGYDVEFRGAGELLRIVSPPTVGTRRVTLDSTSALISDATWTRLPSPYVIERVGAAAPHRVALTFDDGPDDRWTQAILDTLRSRDAKATFFVIGAHVLTNLGLTKRIYLDGHELGNHTFTHPNLAITPAFLTRLELDATERLIEAITNHRSALFRPPYFGDAEPTTADELEPVALASALGYITAGLHIDSNDWTTPGTAQIVHNVLAQRIRGNVVLLHDAGGNRAQTVAAIGPLIDSLRAHGDTIVPLSALMGLTPSQAMPSLPAGSLAARRAEVTGFFLLGATEWLIHWLFLLGVILGLARLAIVMALALRHRLRRRSETMVFAPPVAVIVPAFNEAKVITRTIATLLNQRYAGEITVVVVDDGSPDCTADVARAAYGDDPRVIIRRKSNGGKASALNYGIALAQTDYVICLDADTLFVPDTVANLMQRFVDSRVGAVAGNAKVGNRVNLVTRWQALEYVTSQNVDRRAFDLLDCITVVPGAVGAWRRSAVLDAGGFTHDTLAEDQDATIALRRNGWRVVYADNALAYTEAPDTMRALAKQRFRWSFGTLQCAWKHRDTVFRRRYGTLGGIAMPNTIVFQLLFAALSPLADLLFILGVVSVGLTWVQHGSTYAMTNLEQLLTFYCVFLLVDWFAAVAAFLMEPGEERRLTWLILLQRLAYRQLMYWVVVRSVFAALRGGLVGWGSLERKGTVAVQGG
jgi:peptidoglycan-N-acetylglucosamine deacetylase